MDTRGESSGQVQISFYMYHDTGASQATTGLAVNLNQWTHVLGVYNEDSDNKIKIYVNGSLASLNTDTAGTGNPSDDSAVNLGIGNSTDQSKTFDGTIDDLKIFNRALSADEVAKEYERNKIYY